MGKKEDHQRDLAGLLEPYSANADAGPLVAYITANSNLPGRRANLELAWAFGDLVAARSQQHGQALWELCTTMVGTPATEAPTDTPQEFIPFCGTVGLGAIGASFPQYRVPALRTLRALARDPRWRMREAVCFALQRLLTSPQTPAVLQAWVATGGPLEMRAAAAAAAEPALLKQRQMALWALQLHRDILARLDRLDQRKTEEFRVLRQALGYTLSVVVQAAPGEGFQLLAHLARSQDPDVRWIVKQNLKKNRLVKGFPDEVGALVGAL